MIYLLERQHVLVSCNLVALGSVGVDLWRRLTEIRRQRNWSRYCGSMKVLGALSEQVHWPLIGSQIS